MFFTKLFCKFKKSELAPQINLPPFRSSRLTFDWFLNSVKGRKKSNQPTWHTNWNANLNDGALSAGNSPQPPFNSSFAPPAAPNNLRPVGKWISFACARDTFLRLCATRRGGSGVGVKPQRKTCGWIVNGGLPLWLYDFVSKGGGFKTEKWFSWAMKKKIFFFRSRNRTHTHTHARLPPSIHPFIHPYKSIIPLVYKTDIAARAAIYLERI